MFSTPLVIATILAATLGAAIGSALAYLVARPTINRLRAELAEVAWRLTHDSLTSLHNRAGLRTIRTAIAASGERQRFVVALIDLDLFKQVNDTHGHDPETNCSKSSATGSGTWPPATAVTPRDCPETNSSPSCPSINTRLPASPNSSTPSSPSRSR